MSKARGVSICNRCGFLYQTAGQSGAGQSGVGCSVRIAGEKVIVPGEEDGGEGWGDLKGRDDLL